MISNNALQKLSPLQYRYHQKRVKGLEKIVQFRRLAIAKESIIRASVWKVWFLSGWNKTETKVKGNDYCGGAMLVVGQ